MNKKTEDTGLFQDLMAGVDTALKEFSWSLDQVRPLDADWRQPDLKRVVRALCEDEDALRRMLGVAIASLVHKRRLALIISKKSAAKMMEAAKTAGLVKSSSVSGQIYKRFVAFLIKNYAMELRTWTKEKARVLVVSDERLREAIIAECGLSPEDFAEQVRECIANYDNLPEAEIEDEAPAPAPTQGMASSLPAQGRQGTCTVDSSPQAPVVVVPKPEQKKAVLQEPAIDVAPVVATPELEQKESSNDVRLDGFIASLAVEIDARFAGMPLEQLLRDRAAGPSIRDMIHDLNKLSPDGWENGSRYLKLCAADGEHKTPAVDAPEIAMEIARSVTDGADYELHAVSQAAHEPVVAKTPSLRTARCLMSSTTSCAPPRRCWQRTTQPLSRASPRLRALSPPQSPNCLPQR